MQFIHFFMIKTLPFIFSNQYHLINANALVGQNVKLAEVTEFTAVVAIAFVNDEISMEQNIFCTGTHITVSHILTCEHCFDLSNERPFQILSDWNTVRHSRPYFPSWWLSYDQWCVNRRIRITEQENDLALIKLYLFVTFRVIPLTRSEVTPNSLFFGLNAAIAGWGQLDNGILATRLQTANVTILTHVECNNLVLRLIRRRIPIPGKFLCSKADPYSIITPGDSGGPLIIEGTLVGVTKGTTPKMQDIFHPEKANLHLTIHRYKRFIDSLLPQH